MNYVVYAAAPIPEPPLPPAFDGFRHRWTGWDGTSFDLSVPTAGVQLLQDGITGMHMPEFDQYMDEHASVDGARYRGSRTRTRNPEWTLGIFGDSSKEWRERDRSLWHSLHPDHPGLWTVSDPDGVSRSLTCRYRSAPEVPYARDPLRAGWAVHQVTLLAVNPYWEGAPIHSPIWGNAETPVNFTGPSDSAPDFYVSGATSIGSASMTNPGDVDAHVTYTAKGTGTGLTSVRIQAAGGDMLYGPIAAGSTLRIMTDPTAPIATLDGVDVSGAVSPWDPRPIPAGETSPLLVTLVGQGTLQASFTPRYFRAF
ncbi:phage tail family protein [Oerskovia enterophila]|uniref:hypothetical protein n=1 Tax=Oerskovia enterophila TaxID=43678 RepID=UPI00380CABA9